MKSRAEEANGLTPVEVYREAFSKATDQNLLASFPTYASIGSTLHRKTIKNFPTCRGSALELDIPEEFTKTTNGARFLTVDRQFEGRGGEPKRILVFCPESSIRLLSDAQTWMYDATFASSPIQFSQMFILHALCSGVQVPLLYAFCQNKDVITYNEMISGLRNLAAELELELNPTTISSDFETGSYAAFKAQFPAASFVGCWFHYSSSIWKRV